ncbi:hypothetical protein SNEBB_007608 [Seison nebaliae]|nr:hypothetical protein SNEBB_007608 [Seison nebaliae]
MSLNIHIILLYTINYVNGWTLKDVTTTIPFISNDLNETFSPFSSSFANENDTDSTQSAHDQTANMRLIALIRIVATISIVIFGVFVNLIVFRIYAFPDGLLVNTKNNEIHDDVVVTSAIHNPSSTSSAAANVYLAAMAFVDATVLLVHGVDSVPRLIQSYFNYETFPLNVVDNSEVWCRIVCFLKGAFRLGSAWIVVSSSVERLLTMLVPSSSVRAASQTHTIDDQFENENNSTMSFFEKIRRKFQHFKQIRLRRRIGTFVAQCCLPVSESRSKRAAIFAVFCTLLCSLIICLYNLFINGIKKSTCDILPQFQYYNLPITVTYVALCQLIPILIVFITNTVIISKLIVASRRFGKFFKSKQKQAVKKKPYQKFQQTMRNRLSYLNRSSIFVRSARDKSSKNNDDNRNSEPLIDSGGLWLGYDESSDVDCKQVPSSSLTVNQADSGDGSGRKCVKKDKKAKTIKQTFSNISVRYRSKRQKERIELELNVTNDGQGVGGSSVDGLSQRKTDSHRGSIMYPHKLNVQQTTTTASSMSKSRRRVTWLLVMVAIWFALLNIPYCSTWVATYSASIRLYSTSAKLQTSGEWLELIEKKLHFIQQLRGEIENMNYESLIGLDNLKDYLRKQEFERIQQLMISNRFNPKFHLPSLNISKLLNDKIIVMKERNLKKVYRKLNERNPSAWYIEMTTPHSPSTIGPSSSEPNIKLDRMQIDRPCQSSPSIYHSTLNMYIYHLWSWTQIHSSGSPLPLLQLKNVSLFFHESFPIECVKKILFTVNRQLYRKQQFYQKQQANSIFEIQKTRSHLLYSLLPLRQFTELLYLMNYVIKVFIYYAFSLQFRRSVMKIIRNLLCCFCDGCGDAVAAAELMANLQRELLAAKEIEKVKRECANDRHSSVTQLDMNNVQINCIHHGGKMGRESVKKNSSFNIDMNNCIKRNVRFDQLATHHQQHPSSFRQIRYQFDEVEKSSVLTPKITKKPIIPFRWKKPNDFEDGEDDVKDILSINDNSIVSLDFSGTNDYELLHPNKKCIKERLRKSITHNRFNMGTPSLTGSNLPSIIGSKNKSPTGISYPFIAHLVVNIKNDITSPINLLDTNKSDQKPSIDDERESLELIHSNSIESIKESLRKSLSADLIKENSFQSNEIQPEFHNQMTQTLSEYFDESNYNYHNLLTEDDEEDDSDHIKIQPTIITDYHKGRSRNDTSSDDISPNVDEQKIAESLSSSSKHIQELPLDEKKIETFYMPLVNGGKRVAQNKSSDIVKNNWPPHNYSLED